LAARAKPSSRFGRSEGREAGLKTKKERCNRLACCVFGCFAGNDVVAAGEESEEGRKPFRISPIADHFAVARGRTWRQRVDQTRRTASTVPEGLLCSSWTL
jgi:hypothetical protein